MGLASQLLDEQLKLVQRPALTRQSQRLHQTLPLPSIVEPFGAPKKSRSYLSSFRRARGLARLRIGAFCAEFSSALVNRFHAMLLQSLLGVLLLLRGCLASLDAGLWVGQHLEGVGGCLEDALPILIADRVVLVLGLGHRGTLPLVEAGG